MSQKNESSIKIHHCYDFKYRVGEVLKCINDPEKKQNCHVTSFNEKHEQRKGEKGEKNEQKQEKKNFSLVKNYWRYCKYVSQGYLLSDCPMKKRHRRSMCMFFV